MSSWSNTGLFYGSIRLKDSDSGPGLEGTGSIHHAHASVTFARYKVEGRFSWKVSSFLKTDAATKERDQVSRGSTASEQATQTFGLQAGEGLGMTSLRLRVY